MYDPRRTSSLTSVAPQFGSLQSIGFTRGAQLLGMPDRRTFGLVSDDAFRGIRPEAPGQREPPSTSIPATAGPTIERALSSLSLSSTNTMAGRTDFSSSCFLWLSFACED